MRARSVPRKICKFLAVVFIFLGAWAVWKTIRQVGTIDSIASTDILKMNFFSQWKQLGWSRWDKILGWEGAYPTKI